MIVKGKTKEIVIAVTVIVLVIAVLMMFQYGINEEFNRLKNHSY